jgi:hypothetical protein
MGGFLNRGGCGSWGCGPEAARGRGPPCAGRTRIRVRARLRGEDDPDRWGPPISEGKGNEKERRPCGGSWAGEAAGPRGGKERGEKREGRGPSRAGEKRELARLGHKGKMGKENEKE